MRFEGWVSWCGIIVVIVVVALRLSSRVIRFGVLDW